MSADNGVYILKTHKPPIKDGNSYQNQNGSEFRVAYAQAIDNVDYSDLYLPAIFGDSQVYTSWSQLPRNKFLFLNEF